MAPWRECPRKKRSPLCVVQSRTFRKHGIVGKETMRTPCHKNGKVCTFVRMFPLSFHTSNFNTLPVIVPKLESKPTLVIRYLLYKWDWRMFDKYFLYKHSDLSWLLIAFNTRCINFVPNGMILILTCCWTRRFYAKANGWTWEARVMLTV